MENSNHLDLTVPHVTDLLKSDSVSMFRTRGLEARLHLSKVIQAEPGLSPVFIGGDSTAADRKLLEENDVSHVVNATKGTPNFFDGDLQYLRVAVLDSRSEDLSQQLPEAVSFIARARAEGSGVLVHCLWGISRAPTLVCAYMVSAGRPLREAIEAVSAARPAVLPNSGFVQELIRHEEAVLGRASLSLAEYKSAYRRRNTLSSTLAELLSAPRLAPGGGARMCVVVEGHHMFVERMCSSPRIAVIEGFLTAEEADSAIVAAEAVREDAPIADGAKERRQVQLVDGAEHAEPRVQREDILQLPPRSRPPRRHGRPAESIAPRRPLAAARGGASGRALRQDAALQRPLRLLPGEPSRLQAETRHTGAPLRRWEELRGCALAAFVYSLQGKAHRRPPQSYRRPVSLLGSSLPPNEAVPPLRVPTSDGNTLRMRATLKRFLSPPYPSHFPLSQNPKLDD
eukprot:CAMPEP_0177587458 /NCGR_PEP_ID=MMETSP0419_2-20121207/5663_1 /TAXON_ID=582737 /ORGANISM="Tetraselmis sp., Strain GSL018" /LENGTH=455 /DNA_ID=CAMNT_0019077511 /DNA_START=81 /DNA_END=1447 /DNA_ORIENTATION=+